jgi:hypothetical protein
MFSDEDHDPAPRSRMLMSPFNIKEAHEKRRARRLVIVTVSLLFLLEFALIYFVCFYK